MKKGFYIYCICFLTGLLSWKNSTAQQVSYTQHFVKLLYNYRKSYVLPDNKLLVVYGKNDWLGYSSNLQLKLHDDKGNLVREKVTSIKTNGFPLYFKDIFSIRKDIYFLCFNNIKAASKTNYVLLKFNPDSLTLNIVKQAEFQPIPFDWTVSGDCHICFSPDSATVAVISVSPMRYDFTKSATFHIIDTRSMKLLQLSTMVLGENANVYQAKDFAVTNSGNILILVKYYINVGAEVVHGKPNYGYLIQQYYLGKLRKSVSVIKGDNLVDEVSMKYEGHNNKILVAAFECDSSFSQPLGISLCLVNSDSMKVVKRNFITWPDAVDTTILHNGSYRISISGREPYNIFLDNQKVLEAPSARASHKFDFYRGKLLWFKVDSSLNKKEFTEFNKYQMLEDMPEPSFVFDKPDSMACYVENGKIKDKDVLSFSKTDSNKSIPLNDEYWNARRFYDIVVNKDITLIQPQLRKYLLVKIKM